MSRLIVKGLPKNCTERELKSHFEKYGTVTDVSLKYTKEGTFRRFAFVGFDNDDSASKALKQLNNTFMQTSRLLVEQCKPFGDDTKPRPWSKYAKGSSAYKRTHGDDEADASAHDRHVQPATDSTKRAKLDSDPEFQKFLRVQGGIKSELESTSNEEPFQADSSFDDAVAAFRGDKKLTLIFRGLPSTIKQKNFKEWLSPIRVKSLQLVRSTGDQAVAIVQFNRAPDVRRALQRNEQFLGGFKISVHKFDNEETTDETQQEEVVDEADVAAERQKTTDAILDTGRLFLRNLPYVCSEDDLMFAFKKFGEIASIDCVVDKKTGRCKGFAVITFVFPENALAAYAALDGTIFKGRMLHILPGHEKPNTEPTAADAVDGKSEFQKQKALKLKANAGKAYSWNTLFLGANAVADTLAEKLDVEKSDLLAGDAEHSAGVRMALAETQLVRATREFLLSHGVKLDAFSRPAAKRSSTVMIVKNLPAKFPEDELRRMFERYGNIKRLIFPPEGGVSALLEMDNAVDAKKAFTALAYSRLRSQPMYLEWAPVEVFSSPSVHETELPSTTPAAHEVPEPKRPSTEEEKKELRKSKRHRKAEEAQRPVVPNEQAEESKNETAEAAVKTEVAEKADEAAAESEQEFEPDTTLFVKNLNFETTDDALRSLFAKKYAIRSAAVSKKCDPKVPSRTLSMGFGFVYFYKSAEAKEALKSMQGALLDGHSLELKLSSRVPSDAAEKQKRSVSNVEQGDCTKILVRNIPFQASVKELTELFSAFGELKFVRMPKKMGAPDSHRGFCFVDYGMKSDAKRAFDSLAHSTHLYGRRLVLEWAKSEESVDELRSKTADKFSGTEKAKRNVKKRMKALIGSSTSKDA